MITYNATVNTCSLCILIHVCAHQIRESSIGVDVFSTASQKWMAKVKINLEGKSNYVLNSFSIHSPIISKWNVSCILNASVHRDAKSEYLAWNFSLLVSIHHYPQLLTV